MTEKEKQMLRDHQGSIMVLAETSDRHDKTLYGDNSLCARVHRLEIMAECYLKFAKTAFLVSCAAGNAIGFGLSLLIKFLTKN